MYSEYVFDHCHVGKRYPISPGLYPSSIFNLSRNYKVEIQNKQIKTFQVVLLTRPSVGGAGSVCVSGGGGTYSLDNLPVFSIIICFIKLSVKPVKYCLNWISQTFHVKPVRR